MTTNMAFGPVFALDALVSSSFGTSSSSSDLASSWDAITAWVRTMQDWTPPRQPPSGLSSALSSSATRGYEWCDRWVGPWPMGLASLTERTDEALLDLWQRLYAQARKRGYHADRFLDLSWLPDVTAMAGITVGRFCSAGIKSLAVTETATLHHQNRSVTLGMASLASGVIRMLALWELLHRRGVLAPSVMRPLLTQRVMALAHCWLNDFTTHPASVHRLRAHVALALAHTVVMREAPEKGRPLVPAWGWESGLLRTIHADGGCVGRNPASVAVLAGELAVLRSALPLTAQDAIAAVQQALDRLHGALEIFRYADGGTAVFHGGIESDSYRLPSSPSSLPSGLHWLPDSGYCRLQQQRLMVLMDIGAPNPVDRHEQHAGLLACEVAFGPQRLIVNCGPSLHASSVDSDSTDSTDSADQEWVMSMRSSAAHSALVVRDTNAVPVYVAPTDTPDAVKVRGRVGSESRGGVAAWGTMAGERTVTAEHDGFVRHFGLRHQRTLALRSRPLRLDGTDDLTFVRPGHHPVQFFVRFHLHPSVRAHLFAQENAVILLGQPRHSWRPPPFRFEAHSQASVVLMPSLYTGRGRWEHTQQIVLTGIADQETTHIRWCLRRLRST